MRPKVYKVLTKLTNLRHVDITNSMPAHKLEQWKQHIKCLEDLASDCFKNMTISATSKEACRVAQGFEFGLGPGFIYQGVQNENKV